jgi:hypothetical protein
MSRASGRLSSLSDVPEVEVDVEAKEEAKPELMRVPLVQRAPEVRPEVREAELPSLVTRQSEQVAAELTRPVKVNKTVAVAISGPLKLLAEQKYKPKAEKIPSLIRFEPWLDDLIRRQVLTLQMQGHRKLTKEALVTAAVMEYLGVKEPPTP